MSINLKQKGIALITMMLAIFIVGASLFFSVMESKTGSIEVEEKVEVRNQLLIAKQSLLNYAISYSEDYIASGDDYMSGPGRLPCPDITDTGEPYGFSGWEWCESAYYRHRLPKYTELPSGTRYEFNDDTADIDQRFWYAVSPMFAHSTYPYTSRNYEPLNTTNVYSPLNGSMGDDFALDGESIVAVVIAPGEGLESQSRPSYSYSNNFYDYLESTNAPWWSTEFVTNYTADPENFNDQAIGITQSELMTVVTAKVASVIKSILDQNHPGNGNAYPVNQSAFETEIAASAPAWYENDQWDDIDTYTRLSADEATLSFTGCSIVYTLNFNDGAMRNPSEC